MEIIRKKICIDEYRNRVLGIMPFIQYDSDNDSMISSSSSVNGNYGGFPSNQIDADGNVIIYMDVMYKYHFMMDLFRGGIKLKKVIKNGKQIWIDNFSDRKNIYNFTPYNIDDFSINDNNIYFNIHEKDIADDFIVLINDEGLKKYDLTFIKNVDANIIGKLYIDDNIECKIDGNTDPYFYSNMECPIPGIKMPEYIYYADIQSEIEYMNKLYSSNNPCNRKLWEELGGNVYCDFLNKNKNLYEDRLNEVNSILDEINKGNTKYIPFIEVPLFLSQEYDEIGLLSNYDEDASFSDNRLVFDNNMQHPENYSVESKLETLRVKDFFVDDSGNYLPGLFIERNEFCEVKDGKCIPIDYIPDDYETYTLEQTIPSDYNGFALIKYKNNMEIPYKEKRPVNSYAMRIRKPKPYISISPSTYIFNYEGDNSIKVLVTCNSKWDATSNQSWLRCEPSYGLANENGETFEVIVYNDDVSVGDKKGEILFRTGENKNVETTVFGATIIGKIGSIKLIEGEQIYTLTHERQTITITFTCNDAWDIDLPSWSSKNDDIVNDGETVTLKLDIDENSGIKNRSGNVTIYLINDKTKYITIKLQQTYEGGTFEPDVRLTIKFNNEISLLETMNACNITDDKWKGDELMPNEIANYNRTLKMVVMVKSNNNYSHEVFVSANASFVNRPGIECNEQEVKCTLEWLSENVVMDIPESTSQLSLSFSDDDSDFGEIINGDIQYINKEIKDGEVTIEWDAVEIVPISK